ncbi:MAG: AbgT family transporter [Desulfurococcus sp.]|nr:AbgT family transporter [Desulfurococcus sp.]
MWGASAGFAGAFMNPFTIGVAQSVAELPLFSGIEFRLIVWLAFTAIAIHHVLSYASYASRVKRDPKASIVADIPYEEAGLTQGTGEVKLSTRQKLVLLSFMATFAVLVYGVLEYGWYIDEISALFMASAIVTGFIARMHPNDIVKYFIKGAASLTYGALLVGFARTIAVILREGRILDTIVYMLFQPLTGVPHELFGVGVFLVHIVLDFVICSGSGKALVTMPVMVPLADIIGVTRQTVVLAYQFGDGITNMIYPTCGIVMATIAMAKIPYDRWLRYILPLAVKLWLTAAVFISIAVIIRLGPF